MSVDEGSGGHPTDWRVRTEMLIGREGVTRLEAAHVLVAGLGGVGAVAAEMLCRAGIGSLTIADRDVITASNRNRQLPALCSTEGQSKAEVMAQRLLDINPDLKLRVEKHFIKDAQTVELLRSAPFDYVVDAIDTLSPKVYLILHCVEMGIPVVSSMGSGAKLDPAQVRAVDLSETYQCTFAYDIRKRLRKLGVETGVTAVFSPEPIIKQAIRHQEGEQNKKSVIGTISYMPVVFGCHCAGVVERALCSRVTAKND